MKKLMLVAGMFALSMYVCAQEKLPDCPPGQQPVGITFYIDVFNFHKPRTGCTAKFGLCIKGHWEIKCGYMPYKASLKEDRVTAVYRINGNHLELHLPASLAGHPEFREEDLSLFSVHEDYIYLKDERGNSLGKLRQGDYPVKQEDGELIIFIDIDYE